MFDTTRSLWRLCFAASILALIVLACSPTAEPTATPSPTHTPSPTSTQEPTATATSIPTPTEEPPTGPGTEDDPIVWVFVPSGDTRAVAEGADAVADMLLEETGLHFAPHMATEYAGAVEAMCDEKAHMSSLSTFAYIMAADRGCAEAALVAVRYGSTSYNGQIIAHADSGIATVEDLKGKTFCRPDPLSASGWIVPMLTMKAEGIDPETDLREIVDAGGHDSVVAGVYNGDCDAGATFVDARTMIVEDYPDVMEKVVVIAVTLDIPNDGVQFSTSMPPDLRDRIVSGLLAVTRTDEGRRALDAVYHWEALEKQDDSFYDPFRQLLRAAQVEVESLVVNI